MDRSSEECSVGSSSTESKKMCTDETFFSPMALLEEELIKGTSQHDVYLGNLRRSKSFKVLPHGHMVMLDSDQFNQMRALS